MMTVKYRLLQIETMQVRFLVNQYTERDGIERRFIAGAFGIFGHGNVAGVGQALLQNDLDPTPEGGRMRYIMPRNEQGMVHAAAAYAKTTNRLSTWMCTSSIGPGSLNMVTGAAENKVDYHHKLKNFNPEHSLRS